MSEPTMYNIVKPPMPNLPGLVELYWAPVEYIGSLPDIVVNHVYQGNITMAAGKKFISIYVLKESINFRELPEIKDGQQIYKPELSANIPKDKPALATQLRQMRGRKGILVYKDLNGYYKIIGTPNSPMRFQYGVDVGALPNKRNEADLKFYSNGATDPCYFYNGTLDVTDAELQNQFDVYRLSFTFDWLSADTQDVTIDDEASGTYTLVESTVNVNTIQIYIDKGAGFVLSSSPYVLDTGDVLRLIITRIDDTSDSIVTLI